MEIEIYDMLVFEDENGSIYQDCVCSKELNVVYIACDENEEDEYFTDIVCDNFIISLDSLGSIYNIKTNFDGINTHEYKLKEIWTRTDENTYKKVWHDVEKNQGIQKMKKKIKDLNEKELKSICRKQRCCSKCPLTILNSRYNYYECIVNRILNKKKCEEIDPYGGLYTMLKLVPRKEVKKKLNEEIEVLL